MAGTSGPSPSKRPKFKTAPFPWEEYLKVKGKEDQLAKFDGNLDIIEAKIIARSISKLVGPLKIPQHEKESISSRMQTIITFYSKNTEQPFKKNNGWAEMLLPLILMDHFPSVYNVFEAIREQHVPYADNCEHLLRLLFLYHDPELAQFIVRKRVSFHGFCKDWTSTLFASICEQEIVMALWKTLFRYDEPMIFYLVLVITINNRQQILSMEDSNRDIITTTISSLPRFINARDVSSFFTSADYYKKETPFSFEYEFFMATFGIPEKHTPLMHAKDYICLTILADELAIEGNIVKSRENSKSIEFVVVDLRSAQEFEAGHFPHAINLDYSVHFKNPGQFAYNVEELLNRQPLEAGELVYQFDVHFCFVTSGRDEDNSQLLTFIDPILETRIKFICLVKNGYKAIHDFFQDDLDKLENHDSKKCLFCDSGVEEQKPGPSEPTGFLSRLKRLRNTEKRKSTDLLEPQFSGSQVVRDFRIVSVERHVDSTPIINFITCFLISENDKQCKCWVLTTQTYIEILREIRGRPGLAFIILKRPYSEILKVSSPSGQPEILKLTFGEAVGPKPLVYEKLKLFIPHSLDIELIRNAICSDMETTTS